MNKTELSDKRARLKTELAEIDAALTHIERMEKPWEAVASGYSGDFSTFWKTEEAARKKLSEYYAKTYFKNGLLYGVRLVKYNEDGTLTVVERKSKGTRAWQ